MTIGRPIQFNPETALEAATQLFWSKGYESSSLQDLIQGMNISKSSFYQTFKSKHQLFEDCLKHYTHALIESIERQINLNNSMKSLLNQLFLGAIYERENNHFPRGCLLMNTANEFSQSDPKISEILHLSLNQLTKLFEKIILQAEKNQEISKHKDPHQIALYLVSSMSGLRNIVKAGVDQKTAEKISKTILQSIE